MIEREEWGMFKPVKKTRIYEDIISRIREMVEKGDLSAGDRLPSERDLSAAFRVSRPSVREALKTLESHGYLEVRQGEGTFISHNPIEQFMDPLAAVIMNQKEYQIQILEMRRSIEPQIAALAAERATELEMAEMKKTLNLQKEKVRMGETGSELDKIFHYVIAKAAKNRLLLRIIDTATELFSENRDRYLQFAERPEKSVRHHKEIFNAITIGDSDLAANVMYLHLDDIHETLFSRE
jgi:GntR family transcriptional repressor for pyruvate dehydrogenase complex